MKNHRDYQRHTLLGEEIITKKNIYRKLTKKSSPPKKTGLAKPLTDSPTVRDCETGEELKLTTAQWSSTEGRLALGGYSAPYFLY